MLIRQETFFKTYKKIISPEEGKYTPVLDLNIILSLVWYFRPNHFVEFGVQEGQTAKIILNVCPWIKKYTGIDVPSDFTTTLEMQQGEVPKEAGHLVRDSRFNLIVLEKGTVELDVRHIDLANMVFIDADHSFEGVKRDTELAQQLMASGVIIWHDSNYPSIKKYISRRINAISIASDNSPGVAFEVLRNKLLML